MGNFGKSGNSGVFGRFSAERKVSQVPCFKGFAEFGSNAAEILSKNGRLTALLAQSLLLEEAKSQRDLDRMICF